jgi:hypothetical protein
MLCTPKAQDMHLRYTYKSPSNGDDDDIRIINSNVLFSMYLFHYQTSQLFAASCTPFLFFSLAFQNFFPFSFKSDNYQI